ncbi:hypothetical protein G6F68_021406 [Rhizopus microsporus]|nr:hypothetical protein G6F68_021406 [Rhizopus microsporus]
MARAGRAISGIYTVTLATVASEASEAARIAFTLRRASSVWAEAPSANCGLAPACAGARKPSCPETKTKPFARTACE